MAKLRSWPPSKDRSLRAWGASSTSSKRLRWGRWQQRDLWLSQSYLEATLSQEISCTDASPPGGGSAILPPSSFVRLRACLRRSLAMGGAVTVLGSWSLRLSKGIPAPMTVEFVFAQWTARPRIAMSVRQRHAWKGVLRGAFQWAKMPTDQGRAFLCSRPGQAPRWTVGLLFNFRA